jgi:DNA-binding transcriptional LysR family regulator
MVVIGSIAVEHDLPVDLDLLPALMALLDERHVSRAAERVHVSQPAMSRTLARLRRVFGDELLVRSAGGYHLTPRAERMQRQLLVVGPQLRALFAPADFDPATAEESYRLVGTDYAALLFAPLLFGRVRRESPGSRVTFSAWHDEVFDDLERGGADLAFYGVAPPESLYSEELFEERFVCVVAADHPLARRTDPLDLDTYLDQAHLVVDVRGGDQAVIESQLSALGTRRHVALRLPYHTAATAALPRTDLVATLPEKMAIASGDGLQVLAAPPEIETMSYRMAWHPRLEGDPAQRWLRDAVRLAVPRLPQPAAR